ncbi:MAG: papain-like cysteine protease family protein [Gemmatimonadota bacterium]
MIAAGLAVIAGLLGPGGADPPGVRGFVGDTLERASLEVPFVAQGPLLCGGAAAAMVERYWGARGVYGHDFGHLVREAEGGIRTSELASAMRERGYTVAVSSREPERALAALADGVPPILLLESGATRLHYVVLVGVEEDRVWIHDPNFGPRRELDRAELLRRWEASGYWALFLAPSATASAPSAATPAPSPNLPQTAPASPVTAPNPALDLAMARLRGGDTEGARAAAGAMVQEGGSKAVLGRRVVATSWFLEGERDRALAAWNELGEPTIDLVRIDGLAATRFHVAADRMALEHGAILTPTALALAQRRLAQLPAVQQSRLDYVPLADGSVEVRAAVLERGRMPGLRALALQGVRGLVNQRMSLELGPVMAAGDRWRAAASWRSAQRFLGGSVSTPAPPLPGVATVGVEWRSERFATRAAAEGGASAPVLTQQRRRGFLTLQEWIHPRVRLGASLAAEAWQVPDWSADATDESVRLLNAGLDARWVTDADRFWLNARGDAWTGAARTFAKAGLEAGATIPRGTQREWRLRAGGTAASPDAPAMVWPGAGTGDVRAYLLRAHDLVEDDAIAGPAFGRTLLHATAEHRIFRRIGPARMGASLFADAAHARSRLGTAESGTFVDLGVGLFVEAGERESMVSLAHGAAGWRLSVRVGRVGANANANTDPG